MNIKEASKIVVLEKILSYLGKYTHNVLIKDLPLSLYTKKEEIEMYQLQKLREVVSTAYSAPFYKKKFKEVGINPKKIEKVEDLKIKTTRDDVEKYRKEMKRKNCKITFPVYTTGSTGNPLYVDVSPEQFLGMFPYSERSMEITGFSRKGKTLVVFPREAPSYMASVLGLGLLNYPFQVADFFSLQDQIKKVRDSNYVMGYATRVLSLIQNCKTKDIENLERVLFTAEPLPQSARKFIEEKTSARVHGIYASMEALAPIGVECEKGSYHLTSELFAIEIDQNNDIILTTLDSKRATILLRYEGLKDKGCWKSCNCGITFPAFHLEGKFRHLTSQRIEAAMYSSKAFIDGLISPYFDVENKLEGGKNVFTIYLEKKNGNSKEIANEIKGIIIHGNKKELLPIRPLEIMMEGGMVDIRIKFAKNLNQRIKNPRFW